MRHGGNLISENLQAFCGGAIGGIALCFKPLFLDATTTTGLGVLTFIGVWALKLLAASVMSCASGLATAYGADIYKSIKERWRKRGDKTSPKDNHSKDKAA